MPGLTRFGPIGAERPAIIDDHGQRRDASHIVGDWDPAFFASGVSLDRILPPPSQMDRLPLVDPQQRWAPCVAQPGSVYAIGLNYADHAAETGATLPTEPLVFTKSPSAVCGPYDDLPLPRGRSQVDWEVELAVIIGQPARYLPDQHAAGVCIAGYCLANDVSERHDQKQRGGQWLKGKSHDGFCPLGPWWLPAAEVPQPQQLSLWCDINGQRQQDGHTSDMIFPVLHIVQYLSDFLTLQPGDVIVTGTPAGVAAGQQPPPFLCVGQQVRCGITGLGHQDRRCVTA